LKDFIQMFYMISILKWLLENEAGFILCRNHVQIGIVKDQSGNS